MSTGALLLAMAAFAMTPPPSPSPCDAACERHKAAYQLNRGDIRMAIKHLREAVIRYPEDAVLPLLLARAYLLEDNLFWAEHTLGAALNRQAGDMNARLWLACVHLRQGDPELAGRDLAAVADPLDGPWMSRKVLLEAFRFLLAADPTKARAAIAAIGRRSPVFNEDRAVWSTLHRRLDNWWLDPFGGEVEIGIGHTSNALAGSPTDSGATGTASTLGDLTIRTRVTPPVSSSFRPVLDLEVLGHGFRAQAYRELSSLQGSARLGALFALDNKRFFVGYRAERLLLDQSPSRFAQARRGELEIEWSNGWLAFAGGGHRDYRDERRTRQEWDAGVGGPVRLLAGVSMVLGATVRGADARSRAYDLRGASVAAAARFGLGRGISARITTTLGWDDYIHSGGIEGVRVFGTTKRRRDLLGKLTLGVWSRSWRGWRTGIEGQLAQRNSTANNRPGYDFSYRESRLRVLLRWTFGADPWAPTVVIPPHHVQLEWGLGRGRSGEDERIIELLRQDEELRRGSSCGV